MGTVRLGLTLAIVLCALATMSACGAGNATSNGGNSGNSSAKPTTTAFIVSAPEMDDEHCAEEVTEAFAKLDGVASVECDVPNRTARVYPKEGVELSAKTIWETFESISFDDTKEPKITKIDGPSGVFTSKPDK